jgi:hypothetical protein
MRNAYKILVGKREGKYHSEDQDVDGKINIRNDLRKIGCEDVAWVHWLRTGISVKTVMNLRLPYVAGNILTG